MMPVARPVPPPRALRPAVAERRGWAVLLILAAIGLAYTNSFPGAFYFDDIDAISNNPSLRHLASWHVLWPPVQAGIGGRPFANLTFALNFAISGYHSWSYHLGNLLIHAAAAVLLFAVTRRTLLLPALRARFAGGATAIATVAALLWGLHPLQANIVDYASQRTEGLMAALYLLTFYGFIRSVEDESTGWAALATVACVLGMATKEDMVTAPFMVGLYDITFVSGSITVMVRRHWGRHLALVSTWVLLAGLMFTSKLSARGVGFDLGHSAYQYALTECRSVARYLELAYWPHPLIFDYGPNYLHTIAQALPSALLLLVAIGLILYALRRAPAVGFLGAWFFVTLSPSSSVVPVVEQPCAENRVYLPLVGAMVLLAAVAYRALGRRAVAALALAAATLGVLTLARNPVFASERAVWWDTVAKNPGNARANNNLGNALLKDGQVEQAKPYFATAIQLSPTYADAHNNLGVVYLREGAPAKALPEFQAAIAEKKNYADAHYNLGEAYLELGRNPEAIVALHASLKINPANPKAHNNLGIALLNTGHVQQSIAEERTALQLNPAMPEAHYNLGNSLSRAGKTDEALAEYAATVQIDPKFSKAFNNAGVILLQRGDLAKAKEDFERALAIDPKYPEANQNLQLVNKRLGGK